MQAAIVSSTQTLAASLRRVLGGLNTEKRLSGMDAMLLRLYQPILFRTFSSTNANVRSNAIDLLLDAFPIMVSHPYSP